MMRRIRRTMRKARRAQDPTAAPAPTPCPPALARWMRYEEFERRGDLPSGVQLQMTSCNVTGGIWVKPLTLQYEGLTEDLLRRLRDERQQIVRASCGSGLYGMDELPIQVEMLDNIIEFHAAPPCGCAPSIGAGPAAEA